MILLRRIAQKTSRPYHQVIRRHLNHDFNPYKKESPNTNECANFLLSSTNCIIIISILWGFESYNEKMKLIEDTNNKINELYVAYVTLEKRCEPLTRQLTKNTLNSYFSQKNNLIKEGNPQ